MRTHGWVTMVLIPRSNWSTFKSLCKKATIHQVITMQATSKNVLFPGHNHLLTTGTDDPSLVCWCSGDNQSVWSSVSVVSRWLWPGYRTFLEVVSMVATRLIVAFLYHESDCHVYKHRANVSCNTQVSLVVSSWWNEKYYMTFCVSCRQCGA